MILRFAAALLSWAALSLGTVSAQSYQPSFRPDVLEDLPAGRPNEMLVVGSPTSGICRTASRRTWLSQYFGD